MKSMTAKILIGLFVAISCMQFQLSAQKEMITNQEVTKQLIAGRNE
jgi:hypothetical protein